jgi:hypothetical protein
LAVAGRSESGQQVEHSFESQGTRPRGGLLNFVRYG